MNAASPLLFTTLLLCCSLTAQYKGEPARKVGEVAAYTAISPGEIQNGVNTINQVELRPWTGTSPAPKPGLFYLALTINGGAIMTGLWDMTASAGQRFTKNTDVDALSTTTQFALTVSADHLLCAVDTDAATPPAFSVRSSVTQPFPPLKPMNAPIGYVDCKLGKIAGKDTLFYVDANSGNIVGQTLDRNAYAAGTNALVGPIVNYISNPAGSMNLHSPETMADANGNTIAFICSRQEASGDSDVMYAPSIYDLDEPLVVHDTTNWFANPTAVGGWTFWARSPNYTTTYRVPLFCSTGAQVPWTGGMMRLRAFGRYDPSPTATPWFITYLIGSRSGVPVPFPGSSIIGNLGLLPTGLVTLPGGVLMPQSGGVDTVLSIGPLFPGALAHTQAVALDPVTNKIYLGNTATLFFP